MKCAWDFAIRFKGFLSCTFGIRVGLTHSGEELYNTSINKKRKFIMKILEIVKKEGKRQIFNLLGRGPIIACGSS